jgi:hypothetical protein
MPAFARDNACARLSLRERTGGSAFRASPGTCLIGLDAIKTRVAAATERGPRIWSRAFRGLANYGEPEAPRARRRGADKTGVAARKGRGAASVLVGSLVRPSFLSPVPESLPPPSRGGGTMLAYGGNE